MIRGKWFDLPCRRSKTKPFRVVQWSAISHVAVKSSHKGSKGTKSSTKSTLYLRETSSLGVLVARKRLDEKLLLRVCLELAPADNQDIRNLASHLK
jgi:hypothetical protein